MSTYRCSELIPCREDLCCGVDGYCSSTANACDVLRGCISGCKTIPSTIPCGFQTSLTSNQFTSQLFPNISITNSIQPIVPELNISQPFINNNNNNCTLASPLNQRYPLTPCDLVDIMGGPTLCPYCLYYYDYIREAMELYDMLSLGWMNCNDTLRQSSHRIAAFLAQIKHETGGLMSLQQPIDLGSGALHIIPFHFISMIQSIPRLYTNIQRELPNINWNQLNYDIDLQRNVSHIIMRPEHAFLTAGWWFTDGAQKNIDSNCGDLRQAADIGLGIKDTDTTATGYYKISRCIFGTLQDTGLNQRIMFYNEARRYTDQFSITYNRVPSNTIDPPNEPLSPPLGKKLSTSMIIGIICFFILIIILLVHVIRRYYHGTNGIPLPGSQQDLLEPGTGSSRILNFSKGKKKIKNKNKNKNISSPVELDIHNNKGNDIDKKNITNQVRELPTVQKSAQLLLLENDQKSINNK